MGALKFRVLLDSEKDQEIFRDIIINEEDNFESFYRAILNSFNFEGKIHQARTKTRDARRN